MKRCFVAIVFLAAAGLSRADVVPLGIGYLIGRGAAPSSPDKPIGSPLSAGAPKCFIQVGAITVDAYQMVSVSHTIQTNQYTCKTGQWLNTVGLANGQQVRACTLENIQAKVVKDLEKCK